MCPEWKAQQKILWAEVRKQTGRWKDRWKIRDLLADGRCSRAVLEFLASTDVGRRVPAEEEGAVSEVSEEELREWEEGRRPVSWAPPGGGGIHYSCPRLTHSVYRRGVMGRAFICLFPLFFTPARLLFLCNFFGAYHILGTGLGGGQRGACNVPPPRGQRTGSGLYTIPP